jgi:hypothetical protein
MSMDLFEQSGRRRPGAAPSVEALDAALSAQLLVAWAGEGGETPRLGWWATDLVSEYGGEDLFRRLLPDTWAWAVLEGAREAARRTDAELRARDHEPDVILSLFHLGFELDERLDERLADHKRSREAPLARLPGLALVNAGWSRPGFEAWLAAHPEPATSPSSIGRRLRGAAPGLDAPEGHLDLAATVAALVGGLRPLGPSYPLTHFRRAG